MLAVFQTCSSGVFPPVSPHLISLLPVFLPPAPSMSVHVSQAVALSQLPGERRDRTGTVWHSCVGLCVRLCMYALRSAVCSCVLRETDAVSVSTSEHPAMQPLRVSATVAGSGCVHWPFLGLGPNQCVSGCLGLCTSPSR